MRKVNIHISDGEQEFSYSVSPEVAGALIGQLNEAIFPAIKPVKDIAEKFDFTRLSPTYRELARHLYESDELSVCLTFTEIEKIIDRRLPGSARKHNAWWANTRSHSYSAAWLDVGRKTREIDLASETVVFQKR